MSVSGNITVAYEELLQGDTRPSSGSIVASQFEGGGSSWKVGIDETGHPCILVSPKAQSKSKQPAIALENLAIQFNLRCRLEHSDGTSSIGNYVLLRLTSDRSSDLAIFFSVCEAIVGLLGGDPDEADLYDAVQRIVTLFRRLLLQPTRTQVGLFGEMLVIFLAEDPKLAIDAWREDEGERHDFSSPELRIEVKTTSQGQRTHEFSLEQCDVEVYGPIIVASVMAERISGGVNILQLRSKIEARLAGQFPSIFKLRSIVAEALGSGVSSGELVSFDLTKAKQTLKFYDIRDVPAVRGKLPAGVSGVRFRSNLDLCTPLETSHLRSEYSAAAGVFSTTG